MYWICKYIFWCCSCVSFWSASLDAETKTEAFLVYLFGKRLHTPHSVIVIFIFIATLAEDIYSLRLHVRLGDRREVPLEDWVSLVLQLRC